jgi:cell division GTPase FtsZ|tara:strand:- start:863 stop:1405 length:543 start_codon:yes stop_codon:yes gene_type:complete
MKEIYKKLRDPRFSTFIYSKNEGENRAKNAAKAILNKLKKGNHDVSKSKCVLLDISSGKSELTIDEISEINDTLQEINKNLSIIMSVQEKEMDLDNEIEVKIIFTQYEIKEDVDIGLAFGRKPEITKSLPLYLLEEEYTSKEISEIISFLSEVYKDIGGDKLKIRGFQSIEVESLEPMLY